MKEKVSCMFLSSKKLLTIQFLFSVTSWINKIYSLENFKRNFRGPVIKEVLISIILFKSLRNCKSHKKENFTLKSNSNKIMLCRGGSNNICINQKFNVIISFFRSLYNFHKSELKIFFTWKPKKIFTFDVKLNDNRRKT